ncbi:MAG: hypothetical protein C0407_15875 [Desulfobacca sp.]|nr:hypothetical protein [Desulfobacca sp.]
MATDTCMNCGKTLKTNAKFCTVCGSPVKTQDRETPLLSAEKPRRWLPWILVGSGLLLMVFTIFLVTLWDKRSDLSTPRTGADVLGSAAPSGQTPPESKPVTKYVEPSPTKPPIDLEASDRFNEEGLKAAQEGKLTEGAELFTKAIQTNPNNAKAWNNLGLVMRKSGKIDEAVKAYRQSIQAQADFALAYKNLGIALEQTGDKAGAAQAYKKYCQLDPSAPDMATVQKRADQLKKERTDQEPKR